MLVVGAGERQRRRAFQATATSTWCSSCPSDRRRCGISNGDAKYDAESTWRDLKQLVASCEYSADIYAHLEEFFEDSGESALADDVYVERKLQELQKLSGRAWLYRPFWYSLDLFLPLTRLQAAERWVPLPERRWAWLYLRLHVILGWILVPLGIAAVSGLIK